MFLGGKTWYYKDTSAPNVIYQISTQYRHLRDYIVEFEE